ncbi:hypothetical protein MJO29_012030 [Puccinia striiformis f. sp. tritici]|uniref:hypothetical protein n=1 Tax=Puccinia striiformis f. sp. tritici TaxID=168172 RepID=UPI002008B59D|nr:hypothetical protein Pst134EA_022699 [Puccinia striiformis f. sp. tritici]KAH9455228.1 hypothetical protein Pst134EA_022699 [Puccinia striiformis f. sp. tritici]KAI7945642.1 hypothetical protein MJO29_012030 [Puccinia striiformis f. sp. tritici]
MADEKPSISLDSLLPLLSITSPTSPCHSSPPTAAAAARTPTIAANNSDYSPASSPTSSSSAASSSSTATNTTTHSNPNSVKQQPSSTTTTTTTHHHHHPSKPSHRPHPGNPGGVKVPPGLVAKMAAMTKRKDNLPSTSMSPNQRLDPMAFIGDRPTNSATNSALNINTLNRPNPSPNTILAPSMSTRRAKPMMKLGDMNSGGPSSNQAKFLSVSGNASSTPFANFSKIVDPSGRLNFGGKAVVHSHGVDFSNGSSFSINMNELTLMEELGKGNYGTVQKVFHKPTKVVMAMKEIRLELDDSKLKAILTELDILHRATSDTIVEFYGAFFIESCVYYCMEYMDAGSLDKLAGADVPEPVLARVTGRVVEGLRFLKDELQTIHRDVKPTNVLINQKGETKLCDFGVSGQLERSLAKTNIGCQSYMAPERIQGERTGEVNTYTVSSDVWSLGISIIEFAIGHYPYPPETYSNIFAQLNAIVHGQSPSLPDQLYSHVAIDFVNQCLIKNPKERPTYNDLLLHPFLKDEAQNHVDMVDWVASAIQQVKK